MAPHLQMPTHSRNCTNTSPGGYVDIWIYLWFSQLTVKSTDISPFIPPSKQMTGCEIYGCLRVKERSDTK